MGCRSPRRWRMLARRQGGGEVISPREDGQIGMKGLPCTAMRIAITSGYFDPIHLGHLELLELSRRQADALWVIVNTDAQAALKKGKAFMPEKTRLGIVQALRVVDRAVLAVDADGSVCATLDRLLAEAKAGGHEAFFCKGGDRHAGNIPEMEVLRRHGSRLVEGLGAKIDSSSAIVGKAKGDGGAGGNR